MGSGVILVGCSDAGSDASSAAVRVTAPTPSRTAAASCAALVATAPDSIAGADRRDVSPVSDFVAAWGDPAVVLRCGVPAPGALNPGSQCFVVNGIGWLVTHDGAAVDPTRTTFGTLQFTTIGRSAYVEVTVPDHYQPAADALVDLTPTIKQHTTQEAPCR